MNHDDLYTHIIEMKGQIGHLTGIAEANLEQAKKTNGRLLKAEEKLDDLQTFRTEIRATADARGKMWGVATTIINIIIGGVAIFANRIF